eukprot:820486-Rhodomonas_salina.1
MRFLVFDFGVYRHRHRTTDSVTSSTARLGPSAAAGADAGRGSNHDHDQRGVRYHHGSGVTELTGEAHHDELT